MIKKRTSLRKREIDLTGPEGNAYTLLGVAEDLAKNLGLNFEVINKEMTKGDYENLIQVFDKYFGNYVDLCR